MYLLYCLQKIQKRHNHFLTHSHGLYLDLIQTFSLNKQFLHVRIYIKMIYLLLQLHIYYERFCNRQNLQKLFAPNKILIGFKTISPESLILLRFFILNWFIIGSWNNYILHIIVYNNIFLRYREKSIISQIPYFITFLFFIRLVDFRLFFFNIF